MSIYSELIERVDNGERFHIDFEKRNMRVGKEYLIKDGEYDTSKELFGIKIYSLQVALHMIRDLYKSYKHSLPSERSDSKRRKYFKALTIDELPDDQLMIAGRRETAQAAFWEYKDCGKDRWHRDILSCAYAPKLPQLRTHHNGK